MRFSGRAPPGGGASRAACSILTLPLRTCDVGVRGAPRAVDGSSRERRSDAATLPFGVGERATPTREHVPGAVGLPGSCQAAPGAPLPPI